MFVLLAIAGRVSGAESRRRSGVARAVIVKGRGDATSADFHCIRLLMRPATEARRLTCFASMLKSLLNLLSYLFSCFLVECFM